MAHQRLAVIDTGADGAQPMTDGTGRWTINFNGEIYNYRALRAELESVGRVFRTNSDTEVLVNAIAQWGKAGLSKLRGMYAFALWDSLTKELWLVRDPHGVKPLYYAASSGTLWFSSQAKALAECAPIELSRDPAGLVGFYLWGHVPEPFTWWTGAQLLPAGHFLRVRRGGPVSTPVAHNSVVDCYLAADPSPLRPGELQSLLLDSVRSHLVSDVPVGIFLSAGIDSAVLAAVATELGAPVQTITLAFEEFRGTESDEAPRAEELAGRLGTSHSTVWFTRDDFEALLDDFFDSMDQPSIDGLNTFMVSKAVAARGLKVALSGLGGDELFGGYPSFKQIPRLLRWGKYVPRFESIAAGVYSFSRAFPHLSPKAAGLFRGQLDPAYAYFLRRSLHLEEELDSILDRRTIVDGLQKLSTIHSLKTTISSLKAEGASLHSQISALETCWYMRNQLLRDTDWSSMAHGVEVRVPFVDTALLNRLGPAIASSSPPTKRDLAACSALVPPGLADRPKTGFATPARNWIHTGSERRARGLRGWADLVHRQFGNAARPRKFSGEVGAG